MDAIAKFNAQNKLDNAQFNKSNQLNVDQWNAGQNNQAKTQNWQGKQNLSNGNVDMLNDSQLKNNSIKQQGFDNNLAIAQGKAGAYSGQQNYYQQQGQQKSKQMGDLFNAGASAVASYYGSKK